MNNLIINCSYNANGNTNKLIQSIIKARFSTDNVLFLPEVLGCRNCKNKVCENGIDKCCLKDREKVFKVYNTINKFDNIIFALPIYLNMPTPKLMSFLSRLSCYNDLNGRNLFSNKNAYISLIADVSGTQQTASILMNSLNMLGFNFRGKCITEYINEWKTNKVRGGYLKEEIPYIER